MLSFVRKNFSETTINGEKTIFDTHTHTHIHLHAENRRGWGNKSETKGDWVSNYNVKRHFIKSLTKDSDYRHENCSIRNDSVFSMLLRILSLTLSLTHSRFFHFLFKLWVVGVHVYFTFFHFRFVILFIFFSFFFLFCRPAFGWFRFQFRWLVQF